MKTFKFSLVLRTRENTDVFITLDDNIYGIHSKRVNILYLVWARVNFTAVKYSNGTTAKRYRQPSLYQYLIQQQNSLWWQFHCHQTFGNNKSQIVHKYCI